MKYIFILLFIFFLAHTTFAEWNYKYNGQVSKTSASQGDFIFIGRDNGITELNSKTKEMRNINSLNSDLKGNYINSILKLNDGSLLVSTNKGLSLIQEGIISSDETICSTYPDDEARLLYKSNEGTVWTYSSHKVNYFKNGSWKSIDISDSVRYDDTTTYPFDIWRLFIHGEEAWVLFNDNKKTSTKFNSNVIDLQIRIAIVNENGILRTFQKKGEFPVRQGSYSIIDIGDEIIWKNSDSVYTFDGKEWKNTNKMNYKIYTPYWNQDFIKDFDGNIWYCVTDDMNAVIFPVKYDVANGEVTRYLDEIVNPKIYGIKILDDGTIVPYSNSDVFVKNNDKWDKYNCKTNLGLTNNDYFYVFPNKIQNKTYIILTMSSSNPAGTLICLEDSSGIKPIAYDFPFRSLTKVFINSKGEGLYEGNTTSITGLKYQFGNAYLDLMPFSIGMITKIKNVADGKIYFNGMRLNQETTNSPFVSTWEDINITKIDMGFKDKEGVDVQDFDSHSDEIYALGSYAWQQDSMNVYVSIYNTKDKSLQKYDKNNADLPDWYWTHVDLFWTQHDTIPQFIQVDKEKNAWILTSYGILKFRPEKTEKYPRPRMNPYVYYINMQYDSKYNEILFFAQNSSKIWFFNTENAIWDSLDFENTGIKGGIIKNFSSGSGTIVSCKKLIDNRIYASDNLGYLYQYAGQGHFQVIDLNIYGMQKLTFPINDFCLGGDGKFYLGTDIGLFINDNFTDIEENVPELISEFFISPNPASDYIVVGANGRSPLREDGGSVGIRIYDIFGKQVLSVETQCIASLQKINISTLPAGVYFVKIGNQKPIKFIKL